MAEAVYVLCAVTSMFCAVMLARSYRKRRTGLLRWSMWCFVALAANNSLLFVDLVIIPHLDLSLVRNGIALAGISALLIGLLWEDS